MKSELIAHKKRNSNIRDIFQFKAFYGLTFQIWIHLKVSKKSQSIVNGYLPESFDPLRDSFVQ